MNWPTGKYKVILADPPWSYRNGTSKLDGLASSHYSTMSHEAIGQLPVQEVADDDCVVLLWATFPKLKEAIHVVEAWGFEYVTVAFTWVKLYKNGFPRMGLGFWSRGNAEICLLGKRGKPKRINNDVSQIIEAPVTQHSRKPDVQYERIEHLLNGPYLELFGRSPRVGWTVWGNQVDKFPEERSLWTPASEEVAA